ncbi:MAG: SRPBCC domain-containing protein [Thermoanaerobaculia bacterium]
MNDTATSTASVRIERTFDAPRELIWTMWTDPEAFARWYGPPGARVSVATMDVRVGGRRHLCMEMDTPNGAMQMWFTGEYRCVEAPSRLVYTESMSDPEGNVVPAVQMGMPPDHPDTTEVMVDLDDLGGRTRMIMTHAGLPAGSPAEHGWNAAFDKLRDALTGA